MFFGPCAFWLPVGAHMQMRPPGVWNEPVVVSQEIRKTSTFGIHALVYCQLGPVATAAISSDMPATVQPRGESNIVTSDGSKSQSALVKK